MYKNQNGPLSWAACGELAKESNEKQVAEKIIW